MRILHKFTQISLYGRAYMGKVCFSEGLPGGYNEGTMTVTVLSDGLVKYTFNSIVSPYSQYECYSVNGGEPTGWNEGGGGNSFTFIDCIYNAGSSEEVVFVDDLEDAFNNAYGSKPFSLIRLKCEEVVCYSGMLAVVHREDVKPDGVVVEDDYLVWSISAGEIKLGVILVRHRTNDGSGWSEWKYGSEYSNEGSDSPIDMNEYNFIKAMVMPSVEGYGNMLYIESPIDREFYYRLSSADGSFDYCNGDVYEYGCEGIYSEPIPLVGFTMVEVRPVVNGEVSDGLITRYLGDPRYEYALNMRFSTIQYNNDGDVNEEMYMKNVFDSWFVQFNYDLDSNDGWRFAESGNYNYVMYAHSLEGTTTNSFQIQDAWVTGDDYVMIVDWYKYSEINYAYNLYNPSGTRQVCCPIMLNSESNIGKMFKAYDWLCENWNKIPSDIVWLDGEEPMYDGQIIEFTKETYIGTPYLFGMLCYLETGNEVEARKLWNDTISPTYSLSTKDSISVNDMKGIYVSFTYMVECLKGGRYKVIE